MPIVSAWFLARCIHIDVNGCLNQFFFCTERFAQVGTRCLRQLWSCKTHISHLRACSTLNSLPCFYFYVSHFSQWLWSEYVIDDAFLFDFNNHNSFRLTYYIPLCLISLYLSSHSLASVVFIYFCLFHLQAFIFRWLHFSFLLSVPFPSDSSFSRHECLSTAFFLFCIYSSLSPSSSCSCSVVSFRTGHYAECVPLQTLISRHYHPGPSQGAFSVSISVWVLVCYLLHLMSCLRPKLQSIYFRHSMLVCVIPYWRNAVAAHLPELSIRVSPHSRSVLLVPLMSKKWPIIN